MAGSFGAEVIAKFAGRFWDACALEWVALRIAHGIIFQPVLLIWVAFMSNINRDAKSHIARVRIQGAHKYQRSFRRREDAEAWAQEVEGLVLACAAPNPVGPLFDRVAVDYARHHPKIWSDPGRQSMLSNLRRRFGKLPVTTILSADVGAWVGDSIENGADMSAMEGLLDQLQSILSHAPLKMKTKLPIGNPVRVWRERKNDPTPAAAAPSPDPLPAANLSADSTNAISCSENALGSFASVANVMRDLDDMDAFIESGLRHLMGGRQPKQAEQRPEFFRSPPAEVIRAYDAMVSPTPVASGGITDVLRDLPALVASAVAQALTALPMATQRTEPLLVDAETAARMMGLSASTLKRDRQRRGGMPYVRIGSRVLYSPEALRAWVAQSAGAPRKN